MTRGIVVLAMCLAGPSLFGQQVVGPSSSPSVPAAFVENFSGTWDYNAGLSVDAATGRPEQAPRSATQRNTPGTNTGVPGAPRPPSTPQGSPGGTGGGSSSGGSGQPVDATGGPNRGSGGRNEFDDARRAMAAVIAAERRTLIRDLLEVPEKLVIRATPEEVTIEDDLHRARTFAADGKMRKYQLSAARFDARGLYQGQYFRKDIEGPNDFKMSETYFLSDDRRRLFVIIRIGDPKRPELMAGVNRVYDRIDVLSTR